MLGHIENNMARHKLADLSRLGKMLNSVVTYIKIHALPEVQEASPIYPTHKTEEEKRLLKNKRARITRAKAKEQTK